MSTADGNSLVTVVVVPAVCGIVGLLVLGPFGFFAGVVLALILGEYFQQRVAAKDDRIAELEERVEELEGSSEG